jgi:hypothetical protein
MVDFEEVKGAKYEDSIECDGRTMVQVQRREDLERKAMRKFDYAVMPLITAFCEQTLFPAPGC